MITAINDKMKSIAIFEYIQTVIEKHESEEIQKYVSDVPLNTKHGHMSFEIKWALNGSTCKMLILQ